MSISRAQLEAVSEALAAVLPLTAPADVALRGFFRERPDLGLRDRGLVAETVYAVLRRKRLLDRLAPGASMHRLALAALTTLQGYSVRDLEPAVGKAGVDWLRALKARPQETIDLATQAELPDWVIEKLRGEMSDAEILELGQGLQRPAPLDLRVNTGMISRDEVMKTLAAEGIAATATPFSPIGVRLAGKRAIDRHPLFLSGRIEVQDEGSQLIGFLVAPKRHDMVVDFCAGAGGKTLLLGALMRGHGRVYAFDVSQARLANLKPRLKRSALSNVFPVSIASESDLRVKRLGGKIDRVLIDAPCSGLGTLRRNPDLKWRQSVESVEQLKEKQFRILSAASHLLKVGGRLVYATCSLLAEENEAVVERFLAVAPQFNTLSCKDILAQQKISLACGTYLRLFPHVHGCDGFFAAAMERSE
jgi:16S rRNA (cytosine967-C5)-methyltransferase